MQFFDLAFLALASMMTMIYFVQKTNIEQSKVRVKVKKNH